MIQEAKYPFFFLSLFSPTLISYSQGKENETNLGANSSRGAGRAGEGCVRSTNKSKSTLQQRLKLMPEDAILNVMDSELCISNG